MHKFNQVLNKDEYWIAVSFILAAGSKGKGTACLIVNSQNEIISCACDKLTFSNSKHAFSPESLAVLKIACDSTNSTAYLTHTPNYDSVMLLIAANIKRIVYFPNKCIDQNSLDIAKSAYVQLEEFKGNLNWVRDYFQVLNIF